MKATKKPKTELELINNQILNELMLWGKHLKLENKHFQNANKLCIKWKKLKENVKN